MALTDVISSLPFTSQLIVSILAITAIVVFGVVISQSNRSNTVAVVAATAGAFFLADLFLVHTHIFGNAPGLFYWFAKPIWVGIPMFAAAWYIKTRTDISDYVAYAVAGIAGIVTLQLYYSVVPIPMADGTVVQIGLAPNLVLGLPIHGFYLLAALVIVLLGVEITGEPS